MADTFCIYVFSDEDCLPIYVGKAKNFDKRLNNHLNRDRFRYDTWFYRWLNKQIREDKQFFVDILEEVNQDNWQEKERYWIKHIKENGFNLKNMTDGGDGNNNQIFSEECQKIKSMKLRGVPRPKDVRERISKSHKGKIISEETKRKLSEINKGKPCLESTKLKFSKPVLQYSLDSKFIQEFPSLTKAAEFLNCRKSSLSNVIKRKKDGRFKNFRWSY